MLPKQFCISKMAMFALLSICMLLCMGVAAGATLDVFVYDGGNAVGQASVYIDDNPQAVGLTDSSGALRNINVSPGFHKVFATFGQKRGTSTFIAQSDTTYTSLNVYLT
jgi:hypothetical protein